MSNLIWGFMVRWSWHAELYITKPIQWLYKVLFYILT